MGASSQQLKISWNFIIIHRPLPPIYFLHQEEIKETNCWRAREAPFDCLQTHRTPMQLLMYAINEYRRTENIFET